MKRKNSNYLMKYIEEYRSDLTQENKEEYTEISKMHLVIKDWLIKSMQKYIFNLEHWVVEIIS